MRSKQSGFTLVEIAIVLVIIGLLLGGVLKGQELINSAKIKNLVNDMNGISTAVYGYQDRYKALPGDDLNASSATTPPGRWAGTAAGDGNAALTGAFDAAAGTPEPESRLFWQHLRLAGFIGGETNSAAQPINAVGGIMGVQWGIGNQTVAPLTQGLAGLVICHTNILGRIAESLDNQLDDGKPNGGAVRSWRTSPAPTLTAQASGSTSPDASYVDDGNTLYTVCKKVI